MTNEAADSAARVRGWYFAGLASFMLPAGIQSVLLPHLLTVELQQSAARFGVTQMLGQLPLLALLLVGGLAADRGDPRRLLIGLQLLAAITPLGLAMAALQGALSEGLVLFYALAWGTVTAFAMPARDGLLPRVAQGNVQGMVAIAMAIQFAAQIAGYAVAGLVPRVGIASVLLAQALVLAIGAIAAWRLPSYGSSTASSATAATSGQPAPASPTVGAAGLAHELFDGLRLLFADRTMRGTFVLVCGVGVFFAGNFAVLLPLAVRELYGGNASDISTGFTVFMLGTLTSIAALMRYGGIARPGLALITVLYLGCVVLLPIAFGPPRLGFFACLFLWGMGGGVAMTMSRSIMQEHAPASHRSRVMAAFALANAGGAPLGSLLMGLAVEAGGVRSAIWLPIVGVAAVTTLVSLTHPLARLRSGTPATQAE